MNGWDFRENWALYLAAGLPALLGGGVALGVVFALGWLIRGGR